MSYGVLQSIPCENCGRKHYTHSRQNRDCNGWLALQRAAAQPAAVEYRRREERQARARKLHRSHRLNVITWSRAAARLQEVAA